MIILIAHLIILLSYYSNLIALIRVKKSIRKHKTLSKVIDERETCCLWIFN